MLSQYPHYESMLAGLQAFLVMLGMGASLQIEDFARVAREPRGLLVGLFCQFLLAPALTVLVLSTCSLDPGIEIGLILVAAMPGGPLANLYTHLARGNSALSVTLGGVASIASMITVPLMLYLFREGRSLDIGPLPVELILADVAGFLLCPLFAGMFLRELTPRWSPIISTVLLRAGLVILLVIVIGSLGSGRIEPLRYGWWTPSVIVVLGLAVQNLSMALFLPLRWPVADQTAVGIGVTIRNINLAIVLGSRLFPAVPSPTTEEGSASSPLSGGVLYAVLFWGALSMMICAPSIFVQRRALAREEVRKMAV